MKIINAIECTLRMRIPAIPGAQVCTAHGSFPLSADQVTSGPCQVVPLTNQMLFLKIKNMGIL